MPDPTSLPTELFEKIVGRLPWKQLPKACIVSRPWHVIATKCLYKSYNYNDELHFSGRLLRFTRTIISNPEIAALVHNPTIRSWPPDEGPVPFRSCSGTGAYIPTWEQVLLVDALDAADLRLERQTDFASVMSDRRALVALLIAHLPNLTLLDYSMRAKDEFFGRLLGNALRKDAHRLQKQVLQNLTYGRLDGWEYIQTTYDGIHFNMIRPIFFLPRLQNLTLLDLGVDEDDKLEYEAGRCSISHLTLKVTKASTVSSVSSLVRNLFNRPRVLRSARFLFDLRPRDKMPDATILWSMMALHQETLEELELRPDNDRRVNPDVNHYLLNVPSTTTGGSLSGFRQLKSLNASLDFFSAD